MVSVTRPVAWSQADDTQGKVSGVVSTGIEPWGSWYGGLMSKSPESIDEYMVWPVSVSFGFKAENFNSYQTYEKKTIEE